MCVSAETSFGLTVVLAPAGIYCLKIASQRDRRLIAIAAIPLFFAVQQFCEGLVWIGIGRGNTDLTKVAAEVYLFFALAFWLFWIPFSAMFVERRKKVKVILLTGALLGLMGGLILFLPVAFNPDNLQVSVVRHSIFYDYPDPPALIIAPQIAWHLFYTSIVSLPLIFLKEKLLVGYGTAIVVTAILSHAVFFYAFASIWCFMAACVSLYFCYVFYHWPVRRTTRTKLQPASL